MIAMMIYEVLWNREVVGRELVLKHAKEAFLGKYSEAVPVPKQGCTGIP